jgi:hypothetical protein
MRSFCFTNSPAHFNQGIRSLVVVGFSLCTLVLGPAKETFGNDTAQQFKVEYAQAARRLRAPLENFEIFGHKKALDYDAEIRIKTLLAKAKYQVILSYSPTKRIATYPDTHVSTITPDWNFRLAKKNSGEQYLVEGISTGQANSDLGRKAFLWGHILRFVGATYSLEFRELSDVLSDPTCEILEVTTQPDGNVKLRLQVGNWRENKNSRASVPEAVCTLVPKLDWALRDYEITFRSTSKLDGTVSVNKMVGQIAAERSPSGAVLPKSVRSTGYTVTDGGSLKKDSEFECVFDEVKLGAVKDKDFLLSAFGLSDSLVTPPTQNRWRFSWKWLLIAAAVSGLAAAWLRLRSHHRVT